MDVATGWIGRAACALQSRDADKQPGVRRTEALGCSVSAANGKGMEIVR
jgi:hypothetical protein